MINQMNHINLLHTCLIKDGLEHNLGVKYLGIIRMNTDRIIQYGNSMIDTLIIPSISDSNLNSPAPAPIPRPRVRAVLPSAKVII